MDEQTRRQVPPDTAEVRLERYISSLCFCCDCSKIDATLASHPVWIASVVAVVPGPPVQPSSKQLEAVCHPAGHTNFTSTRIRDGPH